MIYGTDYLEIPLTDAERFGFFSRAALEWMLQSKRNPDIIHCHDWQTAPCAKSYWEDYNAYGLDNPRIVFTIHNLNYGKELIKEAMTYSQASTTVSRTYREEIATHGSIVDNLPKFHGVVNGIDPDIWDPSGDDFLPRYYDETEVVAGKAAARQALCAYSNIPNKEGTPLVGIVTRLTSQKGVHMIRHGIKRPWSAVARLSCSARPRPGDSARLRHDVPRVEERLPRLHVLPPVLQRTLESLGVRRFRHHPRAFNV